MSVCDGRKIECITAEKYFCGDGIFTCEYYSTKWSRCKLKKESK